MEKFEDNLDKEIVEMFASLPKHKVPAPAMQRKYLIMPIKSRAWFAWVHLSKFVSISMGALLLIAGFATTAYGAARSLPGASLFPLKKLAEQIQLDFASNDIQRANIQLKITQARLADAQEVISSPNSSSEQQAAALNELASQTGAAVQTVQSAAASNQDKSPLVASLNNISSQQQALINTITSDDSENSSAATATPKQAVATLMAATASEQAALIYLNQGSGSVQGASTGTPTSTTSTLPSIISTTTSTPTSTMPSVLPTSTSTATSTLPIIHITAASSTSMDENNIPLPAPSQAIGTFIPESPAPQFQP